MIAGMAPLRVPGRYCFCTTSDHDLAARGLTVALASFREVEGVSLILTFEMAASLGFATDMPMALISLQVHSSLAGVGLTAAVASKLAQAGIACNMVAAYHHDHAFVPEADAEAAMDLLLDLAKESAD